VVVGYLCFDGGTMMNIINMFDDFQLLCKEVESTGKFKAYKRYTMKYPELFQSIFKGLYMTEIDNLKDMISHVDFLESLKIVQDNEKRGIYELIIKETERVVSSLKFTEDFDLYLGIEIGNIGGFSAPNPKGKPFIYIGVDKYIDELFIKYFIPHELNHMVRCNAIEEINLFDFMERVISEGLGSFCPIALYNMEYSIQTISEALNLPKEEAMKLMIKKDSLMEKMTNEFGTPLTQEKMKIYFTWSVGDEQAYLSGYFIGMEIIKELVDEGYDFAQLTVMPSQLILKEYNAINHTK
jgi:uncharacterized protein YjaZ